MNTLINATRKFLNLFIIQDETPPRITRNKAKPKQPAPAVIVYESRTQLERRAACILSARGARFDVWGAVRSMTNNELNEIITKGY